MKKFFCLLAFIGCFAAAFSQPAELKGRIIDGQTSMPLSGATVAVKGSSLTVTTNKEGYYSFSKLNTGKIVLSITYVGYETKEIAADITEGSSLLLISTISLEKD